MEIEVLHIDACPNWEDAGQRLTEVLGELGVTDSVLRFTLIRTPGEAAGTAFAGSPTVLINGVDAVAGALPTTELACRIYRDGARTAGIPAHDALREAILSHIYATGS